MLFNICYYVMETYGKLHVHKVGERMTRYRTAENAAQQEPPEHFKVTYTTLYQISQREANKYGDVYEALVVTMLVVLVLNN